MYTLIFAIENLKKIIRTGPGDARPTQIHEQPGLEESKVYLRGNGFGRRLALCTFRGYRGNEQFYVRSGGLPGFVPRPGKVEILCDMVEDDHANAVASVGMGVVAQTDELLRGGEEKAGRNFLVKV